MMPKAAEGLFYDKVLLLQSLRHGAAVPPPFTQGRGFFYRPEGNLVNFYFMHLQIVKNVI